MRRMGTGVVVLAAGLLASGAADAAAANWGRYTDPKLGFTLQYPPGWVLDTQYTSVSQNAPGVAFHIPPGFGKGTNLSDDNTLLSVESLPGKTCKAAQFTDSVDSEHSLKADGRTYDVVASGDAGAGNFYDTTVFAIAGSAPCIAVRYLVHSTNIGAYDPGTVKAFDAKALTAAFDSIRATLKLKGEK